MDNVQIKQIAIQSYRGIEGLTIDFTDKKTTIAGANGTGKSTLLNAYLWTLWGIDQEGRKDYEVKHLDEDGATQDKRDTSVTITLEKGGDTTTLKRTLRENWVKPQGAEEEVFKGNTTIYEINGVPVKMTEYNAEVDELLGVPAGAALLLTTPTAYLSQPWKDLRKSIIDIAGGVDPLALIAEVEGAKDLIKDPAQIDKLETERKASKRKLATELKQYQPRIDQVAQMKPAEKDWSALEKELEEVNAELGGITDKLEEYKGAGMKALQAEQKKRQALNDLARQEAQINSALVDAEREAREQLYTQVYYYTNVLRDLLDERPRLDKNARGMEEAVKRAETLVAEYDKQLAALRQDWKEVKAEEFPRDAATCPTCGRPLPAEEQEAARQAFEMNKRVELDEINARGKKLAGEKAKLEEGLATDRKDYTYYSTKLKQTNDAIEATEQQIKREEKKVEGAATPVTDKLKDLRRQLEEVQAHQEEIQKGLQDAMQANTDQEGEKEASRKQKELLARRDEITLALAERKRAKTYDTMIENLEQEAKQTGAELAAVERDLATITAYRNAYISQVEEKANSLVAGVTFRMFDFTIDGNAVETCTPLIAGVPYQAANTASRINAGVDFANRLYQEYGTALPIWIDGAESVTEIHHTDGQQIALKVVPAGALQIEQ